MILDIVIGFESHAFFELLGLQFPFYVSYIINIDPSNVKSVNFSCQFSSQNPHIQNCI